MLPRIRSLVYKMGFRPKPGTVLYSPSIAYHLAMEEAWRRGFDPTKFTIILDKSVE